MNFYIFRHGETYFSKNNLDYNEHVEDAQILAEGFPALEHLGGFLKNVETDINISSTYKRCRQTVKIVGRRSEKKFVFEALLRDWDSRNETVEGTANRITDFHQQLTANDQQLKSVCICSHGYPIAMLKSLILTGKVDLSKLDDYPETGVLLIIKHGKVEEIDFNS